MTREVRATFPDGTTEVMPTEAALRMAHAMGLELVVVSPRAVPPLARAVEYSQYEYELNKKQRDAARGRHVVQVKELTFRPNTGYHDYEVKKHHAIRFLKDGDRVKAVVQFRGREIVHADLGRGLLLRFAEDLLQFGTMDEQPEMRGCNLQTIISPL